jgi:hypothetical protein
MQFNLSAFHDEFPITASSRAGHWFGLGVVVLFGLIASIAVGQFLLSRSGLPGGHAGLIGVLVTSGFFISMGIWIFLTTTQSPDFLRVDSKGLTFRYPSGREDSIQWVEPKLRLHFEKTEGFTRHGTTRPPMAVLVGNGVSPSRFLPLEAFSEILSQARGAGLDVVEGTSLSPRFTRVMILRR